MAPKICPLYKTVAIGTWPTPERETPPQRAEVNLKEALERGILNCDGNACAWFVKNECGVKVIPQVLEYVGNVILNKK